MTCPHAKFIPSQIIEGGVFGFGKGPKGKHAAVQGPDGVTDQLDALKILEILSRPAGSPSQRLLTSTTLSG